MVVVDCSSRAGAAAASQLLLGGPDGMLPGTDYSKSSVDLDNDVMLLSALSKGTLVLSNVHKVSRLYAEVFYSDHGVWKTSGAESADSPVHYCCDSRGV